MSKLDRDLRAVMEDAFSQGERLLKALVPILISDELTDEEKQEKLAQVLLESKPKTYDDYVHDIKRAFKEDGWTRKL